MFWICTGRNSSAELGALFRYADDFVVVCRSKTAAERALEMIRLIMEKLKLTLHPAKTRLVDLGMEGFEFLGFHFHKRTDRRTRKVLQSAHSVQPQASSHGEDRQRPEPGNQGMA